jgi:hypothetical protein
MSPLTEQSISSSRSSRGRILRRFATRFVISLAIGGGLFYLAFRGLRPEDLWDAFRQADYRWIGPFFLTLAGVQLFRSWRWQFLLQPIIARPPGLWRLLMVSSVGFAAIMLLPLRLGEFVRPFLIADPRDDGTRGPAQGSPGAGEPSAHTGRDGQRLRMSAALGTIAVERAVDGLLVSLFLFGSFLLLGDRPGAPGWMMPTAYTALAVFGAATVFLATGLRWPRQVVTAALALSGVSLLARRFGGRAARLRDRLEDLLGGLISGFAALSDAGCLLRFVTASLIYWFFNGLGFFVLAQAFHLELSLVDAFALCGMVAIGIILPAGPGLVGNFHEFGKFGLQLSLPAAVIAGPGMAFVVLIHGLHFVWYVGLGLVALRSRHVRTARVLEATVSEEAPLDEVEKEVEVEAEADADAEAEAKAKAEAEAEARGDS